MSIAFSDSQMAYYWRLLWTRVFADGIVRARTAAGRSPEEAACRAGMDRSQWMALEAGAWRPQTTEQLRAIAAAVEMKYEQLFRFVGLCLGAWES